MLDSEGWAQQHVKPARMSMKRMSSLRRSWVFCNELSTKIVSPICATERTTMIVPWHDERTRTEAVVILPADELLSANINKKRRQCELPMTTDFDAQLRTQTIITDKVYLCRWRSWILIRRQKTKSHEKQNLLMSVNLKILRLVCWERDNKLEPGKAVV